MSEEPSKDSPGFETGAARPPQPTKTLKETERIVQGGGPGRGGPMGGGMVGQKASTFGPSAKRLIRRMAPERTKAIGVVLLAVVSVALMSVGPAHPGAGHRPDLRGRARQGRRRQGATRQQQEEVVATLQQQGDDKQASIIAAMKDFVVGQGVDFTAVGDVLMLVLAVYVAASLLAWLQGYLLNDVVQGTVRRMRSDVEDKVNALPLSYFDKQPRGELLSRVTNDIDNISQSLQQTMSQLLTSLLTVVFVVIMMFSISWQLALVALVTVPITMFVTGAVMKRSQGMFIDQWRRTGKLNAHIEETFSGQALVKVFGRQAEVERTLCRGEREAVRRVVRRAVRQRPDHADDDVHRQPQLRRHRRPRRPQGGQRLDLAGGRAGVHPVLPPVHPTAHPGRVDDEPPAVRASRLPSASSSSSTPRSRRPRSAAALVPEPERHGEVRFEHVSFCYDPETPLIEDLSLVAAPGQTVAIVGPTGAGKTTLVNLVMRFYEVTGGRITLDGVDIASVPRGALRSEIGMVLQDTWLFEGTIHDNIAYGNPQATEEQILEAARATFVDRFVHSLPDGYDTHVDEEGTNLSAGERQLVTIARAFLSDPDLLILDEATSSVDTRTELLLQHAMAALRTDRTSFVIAHRLSTIRDADLILVMEDGAIVEQGTHDSLLAAGGAVRPAVPSAVLGRRPGGCRLTPCGNPLRCLEWADTFVVHGKGGGPS